ncbi:RHS repeat-associated core domain-containing protein [Streptomyces sp. NPDC058257]|uniref:RHS repeat-associated core domain-containing protein n=1 Tax=Streptomyces sp. NPDC058257 TaxID=3346409 RepID=UPI0036E2C5AE
MTRAGPAGRSSLPVIAVLSDHQGTSMAAVAMTTLAVTRRKQLPFGQTRSKDTESLPGTCGFVGGTNDPTGLVHLGAREYDPVLGRFLSVDPVIDVDDPAQMNACSYAHNSPLTKSDPDGLRPMGPTDHGPSGDAAWGANPSHYFIDDNTLAPKSAPQPSPAPKPRPKPVPATTVDVVGGETRRALGDPGQFVSPSTRRKAPSRWTPCTDRGRVRTEVVYGQRSCTDTGRMTGSSYPCS